jgi:hypothetical protein
LFSECSQFVCFLSTETAYDKKQTGKEAAALRKMLLRKTDGSEKEVTGREWRRRHRGGSRKDMTALLYALLAAFSGAGVGCLTGLAFPTYDLVGLPHISAAALEIGLLLGAAVGLVTLQLVRTLLKRWKKAKKP